MEILVQVRVTLDTPINVGSGVSGDIFTNKAMVKDHAGLPLIPGSSLKGRLRHHCEQLASSLGLEPRPCGSPVAEAMCQPDPDKGDAIAQLCPACRLFGSPWYPGPLAFSDFVLVEPAFLRESQAYARTTVRSGVGISRRRRVAEDRLLYTTEVFQPGNILIMEGEIGGQLQNEQDLALLVASLDALFTLGSNKTRGMGWCRLELQAQAYDGETWKTLDLDSARRRWERDAN